MAKNKIIYGGEVLIDLTGDSIAPEYVDEGVTFHDAAGEPRAGTRSASGGASGGGVLTGEFCFDENTITTTIDIGQPYTHFAIFAYDKVNTSSGKGTFLCAADKLRGRLYCVATNNTGSAIQTALYSDAPTVTDDASTWVNGRLSVVAYEQSITITGYTSGTALGYFLAGVTYRWYAWTEGASGGSGAAPVIEALTVTENGTYTAPDGVDGYSPVTVNVSSDTTIEDGLITRTITEYSNDRVTVVATQALSNCKSLTKVSFPLVTILQNNAFYNCTSLVTVELPLVRTVNTYALGSCTSLTSIKLPSATVLNTFALHNCKALKTAEFSMKVSISGQAFAYCSALVALILRSTELCPMTAANAFLSSSIANGTGYIYVPAALIANYQAATNWSAHAAQFRALEYYTVDGTITGELDETKI